jgi:hypothetical protein
VSKDDQTKASTNVRQTKDIVDDLNYAEIENKLKQILHNNYRKDVDSQYYFKCNKNQPDIEDKEGKV